MNGLGEDSVDEHVSDLAERVKALEARVRSTSRIGDEIVRDAVASELKRCHSGAEGSHEVQEETEKP